MTVLLHVCVGYWPAWYIFTFVVCPIVVSVARSRGDARTDRARRSLSELEARRATRPSPTPIDVEPMR